MSTSPFPNFDPNTLSSMMRGRVKWIVLVLAVVGLFFLVSFLRSVYADLLWFNELGYKGVYQKVIVVKVALFIVGALIAGVVFAVNLYFAQRAIGGLSKLSADGVSLIARPLILSFTIIAILVISLIFGILLSTHWELFLRFTNSTSFGILDPVYDKDVGFYIFQLPLYSVIRSWLLILSLASLVSVGVLAFVNFTARGERFVIPSGLKMHMIAVGAVVVLVAAAGQILGMYHLVHSDNGVVFGATYADVNAKKMAYLVTAVLGVFVSIVMLVGAFVDRIRIVVGVVGLWVALIIILGSAWPSVIQELSVNPNEYVKEKQFIEDNMRFTSIGYGLDEVSESFYQAEGEITAKLVEENKKTVENIRLWDHRPLTDVYRQIQLIRPYYEFIDADVDRYTINGEYRQVMLATREVAPEKLAEEAQTWVNRKLFYTHGIGLAMSPVTEFTQEGRPEFFAKDIPANGQIPIMDPDSDSSPDLIVENPRIYYGESVENYVIVNTNTAELDYQTGAGDLIKAHYQGSGGVQVGSFLRKLVYAWQMRDVNILISDELREDSRIQYRRNIQERVKTIAPYLSLDKDPYAVVADGQVFWVQDAYTTSDSFPYSDPFASEETAESFNYIRNSVKIIINAYNGNVDFYIWDKEDPIAATYSKIFPELYLDGDSMPESIKAHIRYPQGYFQTQAEKYVRYHMKDSQNFYGNEDLWAFPNEKFGQGETLQRVKPYYVMMRLPGEYKEEFVLLLPYTPVGRPNMVGWLAARSDGDNYGKLVAFNFPKDRQVDGPEQVEARIDNDQDISAWFTLRCAEGSTCIRGNLLVIPIGDSILYAEPVYIQAEGVSFPELKKVILASSDTVVMEDSLAKAIFALSGSDSLSVKSPPEQIGGIKDTHKVTDGEESPLKSGIENLEDTIQRLKKALDSLEDALESIK